MDHVDTRCLPTAYSLHAGQVDARSQVLDILYGQWSAAILRALADLSIADHLAAGPLSASTIAERMGSVPDRTFRLLRAAQVIGLVAFDSNAEFSTTPMLDTLRTDSPDSLRPIVLGNAAPWATLAWTLLPEAVRAGIQPAKTALKADLFDYLQANPAQREEFSAFMAGLTTLWAQDAADLIDTTGVRCAVDIGGASGSFLRLLQQRNPALNDIIFDRPEVIDVVKSTVATSEFGHRTKTVAGDFFTSVPAADLYLLKMILHDWNDANCERILTRCREALQPGGRVMIIEMLVGEVGRPGFAAMLDLNMMALCPDGRERTVDEFDTLLAAAGLTRSATHLVPTGQSLIEARAA
jgi:hypothetical protein